MTSGISKRYSRFTLALVQLAVSTNPATNAASARTLVLTAARQGAKIVVLPECWNSPYGVSHFLSFAETIEDIPGPSCLAMSAMAKEAGIYLVGGSIPERECNSPHRLYNTCTVWNPEGERIATHRKVHLFDIDIPGGISFQESSVLSPGNMLTHFDTVYGRIGLGICYDMRFPEMCMIAARQEGCIAMLYPGAFNLTTGPLHWELLQRARAVDNQIYVAACSPARDSTADYVAWGHSSVVDPMGRVIAKAEAEESIVYADIDVDLLRRTQLSIPVSRQRRFDVYPKI